MIMDKTEFQINELIIRLLEGQITEKEFCALSEFLSRSPDSVKYYCDFMDDYVSIKAASESEIALDTENRDIFFDWDFWRSIAEYERTANPIKEIENGPEFAKIIIPKEHKGLSFGKVGKFSLYTAILSAAAMLLMILYVQLIPKPMHGEVATLIDMIGAEWGNGINFEKESRFPLNGGPILLSKGIVKINYDEDVQVTIEGPAEFELNSPTSMKLDSGRLYARVFKYGRGFTVDTNNSRIIDLGTEFGVQTGHIGSTELYVYKGKTTLIAFDSKRNKVIADQTAGEAVLVSDYYSDLKLQKIPLKNNLFVRDICSAANIVWKGEKQISLADIVGGGNGLNGGILGSGVNPATGEYKQKTDLYEWEKSKGTYSMVSHPFIDGVFVPDGGMGHVTINSNSQQYDGFKDSTGTYRFEITNGPAVWKRGDSPEQKVDPMYFFMQDLELNGVAYGTSENPAIYMHSNAGITFDLAEIRKSFPSVEIKKFSTLWGVPEQINKRIPRDWDVRVDIYVFLDDKCSFKQLNVSKNEAAVPLSLPIQPGNRFLTLVVVDGNQRPEYNWCIFANPILELSPQEN
jgi:hypothetical protein